MMGNITDLHKQEEATVKPHEAVGAAVEDDAIRPWKTLNYFQDCVFQ